MVEAGQGFALPRGIEENPFPFGRPYGGLDALTPEFLIGEDVPSSAYVLGWDYVVPQFDDRDSNYMDTDALREAFALFDEPAGLDKGSFMYDGEIKSRLSAMCANGMSPTPIAGRSSANSREDLSLYLDSGASQNVVFNPALLINPRDPPAGMEHFRGADGSTMAVIGYGDIEMENFKIPDVYLVQGLTVNLISVGQLASSHKVCCCFVGNECNLMLSDGRQIGGAIRRDDNQYILRFLEIE